MKWLNLIPQRLDRGATPTFAGLLFAAGTAAAPSISFASDSNTGFYSVSSGNVGFSADGAVSLYFGAGGIIQAAGFTGYLSLAASGAISLIAGGTNRNITLTPSGTGGLLVSSKAALGGTVFLNSSWTAGAVGVGADGTDKVIFGYLGATYAGPTVGAHNSALNAWAPLHYSASTHTFRIGEMLVGHINALGRFIIGNGTSDSGALLQIGTNTTNTAGGMVFGNDTFLYRAGAGGLAIHDNLNGTPTLAFYNFATQLFAIQHNGAAVTLRTLIAGNTMTFSTGASVLALTLSATQAATFASTVSAAGNVILNQGTYLLLNGAADLNSGLVRLAGNTILSAGGDVILKSGGTTVLTGTSTGAVTLGGALKLANAYVAGAVVGTGYVTIQDSTGTTYRVPVLV